MLKERSLLVAGALATLDGLAIGFAFALAYTARSSLVLRERFGLSELLPIERYLFLLPLAALFWLAALYLAGAYRSHRIKSLAHEVGEVVVATGLASLLLVVTIFFLRLDLRMLSGHPVSRGFLALWILAGAASVALGRIVVRVLAYAARRSGRNFRNILIVGSSPAGRRVARSLAQQQRFGFRILGLVADDFSNLEAIDGIPVLGPLDRLIPILEAEVVDEVVLATTRASHQESIRLAQSLRARGVNTSVALPPVFERRVRSEMALVGDVQLLRFYSSPSSVAKLAAKRCFDWIVASGLLVAFSPLLGLIALLVRATGPAPVLFRQQRVGLNGRRFTLYKFRTMAPDAESALGELAGRNEMSGPVFKLRADPRVTPLGRVLRRLSLDELPQLWNVVRGDMSLVGPRPPLPEEVDAYEPHHRRRLSMRPGITGPWQVGGRSTVDFDRWMEMDLAYIEDWSLWLDLKILARTVPAVLSGRGAY